MKLKFLFILVGISFSLHTKSYSQTLLSPVAKIEVGVHGLGIGYELPLNNAWVSEFNLHAGGGFNLNTSNEVSFHYREFPSIHLATGIRRYYNLNRARNFSANNAGNFFGAQLKYVSSGLIQRSGDFDIAPSHPAINDVVIAEIHWGIQRNLSERLFYTVKIGVGYLNDFHAGSGTILPTGGAKLAYRIW
ncbi:hypothetical protein KI659_16250 [Litoribacter alkaliphilus]|uniref:DUF3575 domain-containing protein n=1 Tax=Litoribacter ruber TaxID=702568 RepID=A0AAP2CN23_9BACT|nr:hypothetical protein [Litoribacter alkaliphilus]MBS9525570.1 hypothetical protein [Litoribacter alkaliphilus]